MFYYSSLLFVLRMIYWIEVGLNSTVEKASMDSSNHTTVIAFGNSNTATTFALDISKQVFYYWTGSGVYYDHRLVSSNVNGSLRRVFSTTYYYYYSSAITTMVYSNERVYYIIQNGLYVFDLESESSQRLYSLLDTYQSHGMVLLSHERQEQGTRQELHIMFLSSIILCC